MPQPLSKILRGVKCELNIAPDAAAREPELAALVAQAVSICSESDYFLGRVLVEMLGPQAVAPAFAMYEGIPWGYAKAQILRAAAQMLLNAEDYSYFEALLKVYGQDADQRNKFAHWIWVYAKETAGYIVLVNPLDLLREKVAPYVPPGVARTMDASRDWMKQPECYSRAELQRIVRDFDETIGLIETFRNLVTVPSARGPLRAALDAPPRMVEALRRQGKPTQAPPSAQSEPQ